MRTREHGKFLAFLVSTLAALLLCLQPVAQCPPNIDFENGSFDNWTAYTGSVSAGTGQNVMSLNPTGAVYGGQHEIFSRATNAFDRDFFGDFPVVCPNGSGYSVKLGNTQGGAQAEGLSYEFTIPANMNTYSITYHYAVVFEGPNHRDAEQPRLEIEVTNVTDNTLIECSSFKFIPFGSALPGFFESGNRQVENTPVWCKDWTAVTINLNGQAGKTIRLFFKTSDCTFVRHFGYAYIDVNTECTGEFTGATFCPADTSVNVVAPFGFQEYKWFNSSFTQQLGNSPNLILRPPYPTGSLLAVEVTPYDGYGCKDTLYARLVDTLTLPANAGKDTLYCGTTPVLIGENAKPGLSYRWSPVTGLSDPNISNPFASPLLPTQYVLTVSSGGGGCFKRDTVFVNSSVPDTSLLLLGKTDFCSTTGDSAVLVVDDDMFVQWYKDGAAISGARQNRYRVLTTGNYSAMVRNRDGCELPTRRIQINIEVPAVGITYPVQYTFQNTALTLTARNFGAEVLWMPPLYLDNPALLNPIFQNGTISNQLYRIQITSAAGCLTIDTQLVKTIKEITIFVPNAFTPNNDQLNDRVIPISEGIKTVYSFRVFNRWGLQLFSWTPGAPGWDGTFKGLPQLPGVYVWQFRGLGIDEKIFERKGVITLIR
ncbi:T9SS type B sorting domain-containing protein [Lacibacter sp. H407]|uniref:T9SS type B sorting domain-containing protein n=1 Tax=Lacibacter sp. H407 TaxID=3133423 RepID=UPI0030BB7258